MKPGSVRWLTHFRVNSRQVTLGSGPWDWLRGRGWLVSNRLAHLADLWAAIYIYICVDPMLGLFADICGKPCFLTSVGII